MREDRLDDKKFKISYLGLQHALELARLMQAFDRETHNQDHLIRLRVLEEQIRSSTAYYLGAFCPEGHLIGYVWLIMADGILFAHHFFVLPEYRNQGIALLLAEEILIH